ncbi:hypothetical protein H8B13_05260 [Hymenobacter sp. BT188]|uniref:hypothetical protein n=1 Tax=Hymenobacter sp. BT188 TaxID=2763504 RepID=UPI001651868A|nr:hypothetical protein [Hymenobacter sp. BT188]MBC6606219.1 hypothetical protein [Hymenobacter sp. BT188]
MKLNLPLALVGVLALSSCASIVSKSKYPIAISSVPVGANITITDRKGQEVFTGVAPAAVTLKSGTAYFSKAIYQVKFSKPGFDDKMMTLEADLNGWYFGNILFGGVIGLLIVDPLSGAMYRIAEKDMQGVLAPSAQGFNPADKTNLRIMSLEEVPTSLRDKMIPVQ